MGHRSRQYAIAGAFDTETANIEVNGEWHAFAVCYQMNDLREASMDTYEPGTDDHIHIWRDRSQFFAFIEDCIEWGSQHERIPIICGYNLMFDLQTVFADLHAAYDMRVSAQSSTNVYTLDLVQGKTILLRFWDTYHLEMRGLEAMGRTAGLAKLIGTWDYEKVRTPETPLTVEEEAYAARDVQVIPAYLRYLCDANAWLTPDLLGFKVITKTSIVRQMAAHEIAPIKRHMRRGSEQTLEALYMAVCSENFAHCYYDYALRKASFRGGWTFTAARYASVVVRNVASLDVTSMHHLFINGHYMPDQMRPCPGWALERMAASVLSTSVEYVLKHYAKPFDYAFHMRVTFTGIRLKRGSCFERWGIALIPRGKFGTRVAGSAEYSRDDSAQAADVAARLSGWRDRALNARFAFGKLYSADSATLHLSELELWCVGQVYEWDAMRVELGEGTGKFMLPPDYVTLQSNILFERKQAMKHVTNVYEEGVPYPEAVPVSIPEGIAAGLKDGALSSQFVGSYYGNAVKGAFNSIYGCMARDECKPDYMVDAAAHICVDASRTATLENFFDIAPKRPKVLYTYGLRIVGGSRMHLCIAMLLLDRALGERVGITGGDTDSLKVTCDLSVTDLDLTNALAPLADAAKRAIDACMRRVRAHDADLASSLDGIGAFEVERAGDGTRWDYHMEAWNKARVSVANGHAHVTCAGLSRPDGAYTIEDYIDDRLRAGERPEDVLPDTLGYNVIVPHAICHALQRTMPGASDTFEADVQDYQGHSVHVKAPEAIALYAVPRVLGETDMPVNAENVTYMKDVYGRVVDLGTRRLLVGGGVDRG